jgi:hypothetical protein
MRKEYDFSKARPNPYAKRLKRSVTIRLDQATIDYFKGLAAETEILPDAHQSVSARLCGARATVGDAVAADALREQSRTWVTVKSEDIGDSP